MKPATQTIRHDELQNGDVAYVQGYPFRVDAIRTVEHADGAKVVRYVGIAQDVTLIGSGYDGGTYGARMDVQIAIRKRQ